MSSVRTQLPVRVDGHDLQRELQVLQELGERESELLDRLVAAEPEPRGLRRMILYGGWMLVMSFGGLIFTGKAGDVWWGWMLRAYVIVIPVLLLAWQWNTGPRYWFEMRRVRQRMKEMDRRHFIVLVSELGKREDMASQYVVFACHMLGYSQFVEPGEMDRLSPECAMPWDAHRWKAPEAIGTDDALMMILDSRLVQAVPEEQRWGILAKIRHGAREGLKRHQRTIHGRAPTEEEARVIGALMEAAAARGEGPMVGIGHLVERYYGSRDHG